MIIISALYLVSLYGTQAVLLGPILLSDGSGDLDIPWGLLPPAVIANLILAVVAIIFLIKRVRRVQADLSARRRLNHLALAMKLLTIPFFITHLQIWSMMLAAFLVIPGLQILLPFGFLGVAFAYSVVLATSAYSISGLYVQYRLGNLTGKKFARNVIFQLIFVLDVISYLVLYFQIRRSCKEQTGCEKGES